MALINLLSEFNPPGCLSDVEHPVEENGAVRVIVPLGPITVLCHVIPDAIEP